MTPMVGDSGSDEVERWVNGWVLSSGGNGLLYLSCRASPCVQVLVHGMDKAYTLNLSTFQMAAVTLFNHQAIITVKAMADMLELDASEVALALFPLIKGGLLVCNPTAGHVSQLTHGHSISVNKHFTRRSLKVRWRALCVCL